MGKGIRLKVGNGKEWEFNKSFPRHLLSAVLTDSVSDRVSKCKRRPGFMALS